MSFSLGDDKGYSEIMTFDFFDLKENHEHRSHGNTLGQ